MESVRPSWFDEIFRELEARHDLSPDMVTAAIRELIAGRTDPALAAAFLTAIKFKGETSDEIAAAALVLREQMIRLVPVSGPVPGHLRHRRGWCRYFQHQHRHRARRRRRGRARGEARRPCGVQPQRQRRSTQ